MRLLHIVPYAALILLGEVAVASVPGVIAAREGGMGLGSALIMGQATHVAGIAFGAIVAAHLVERRSIHVALVGGALLYYAGLIGVGHQPSHLLGWVVVILALAGVGLGMVFTAAFAAAAGVSARERPYAIALLLLAALVAGPLVGNAVFLAGPPMLVVVAATVVAGAVLVAWKAHPTATGRQDGSRSGGARLTGRVALAGGGLVAIGVLATLWGIEPSFVSAAMVASSLGMGGLDSLDGLRLGMVLTGVVAVAAGVVLLCLRERPGRATLLAAAASAPAAFAVAGLLAIAGFAMPRELSPPDSRGGPIGELVAVAGGAAGLVLGAWALMRGIGSRAVALVGSLLVVGISVLVLGVVERVQPATGALPPIVAIVATSFAGGGTAVALRHVLARAPIGERGLAAAAGVAAGSFGAMAGLMVGAAEGMSFGIGAVGGMSAESLAIIAAALVAAGAAVLLPIRPPLRESAAEAG